MKHTKLFLSLICIITSVVLSACSAEQTCTSETCGVPEPVVGNAIRGTVTKPYVPPMRDVVTVPAQVDPTNTYYRPSHETIVEIIPGRVQPMQFDY